MPRPILLDFDDASVTLALPSGAPAAADGQHTVQWKRADRDEWSSFSTAATLFRKKGLEPGAPYAFRLAPLRADSDSDSDSDAVLRWTQPAAADAAPPAPSVVVELMGSDETLCSATVQWREPSPAASKYEVQYFVKDVSADWTTATDAATRTAIRKKSLPAVGQPLFFRWRAFSPDKGWGVWSHASAGSLPPAPATGLARALGAPALVNAKGEPLKTSAALAGKVVGLYFSAHWCPPCRMFTPQLVAFYEALKALGKPFEIVFVSADHSKREFEQYFGTMPWLAVPFDSPARELVPDAHGIRGIPALHIVSPETGKIVDENARGRELNAATFDHWAALCGVSRM